MAAKRSEPAPLFSAFISHAKVDAKKAEAIAEGLEKRGVKCWIAPRDVKAGRAYGDEIIRGIESARAFVLVLSKASNDSAFVAREVERAVSKKKPVFAIRIADIQPAPALELFISGTQWIDAFPGRLAHHVDRLADLLTEEVEPAGEPIPETPQPTPRWRLPLMLGGAGALVAIVLATALFLRPVEDADLAQKSDPDYQACETKTGSDAIAACDRAIYSGKFSGANLAYLYNGRGYLHMMSGDLDRGQADFNRAIQLDPANYFPYWNRAEILRHRGDTDNARADYQKALTLAPKDDDKLKIEASLSALAARTTESPDPTVITTPTWGNPEGETAAAAVPSYPADAMPVSPPMATIPAIPASPSPMPAAPPPMPVR